MALISNERESKHTVCYRPIVLRESKQTYIKEHVLKSFCFLGLSFLSLKSLRLCQPENFLYPLNWNNQYFTKASIKYQIRTQMFKSQIQK